MASWVLQSLSRPSRVCGSRSSVRHRISCLTPPTLMHTRRLSALDRMIMNGSGGSDDRDRLCSRRYSSCACAGADGGGCLVPGNLTSFWLPLSGCSAVTAAATLAAAVHRTAAPIGGNRGPPPLFSNPVTASRSVAINRTPGRQPSISCRPFVRLHQNNTYEKIYYSHWQTHICYKIILFYYNTLSSKYVS